MDDDVADAGRRQQPGDVRAGPAGPVDVDAQVVAGIKCGLSTVRISSLESQAQPIRHAAFVDGFWHLFLGIVTVDGRTRRQQNVDQSIRRCGLAADLNSQLTQCLHIVTAVHGMQHSYLYCAKTAQDQR